MRMVECHSEVVFVFDRFVCSPVALATGLAQGCPLSCILYILAVDGMLEYASKTDGVDMVAGFCGDWSFECEDIAAMVHVQQIVMRFELASGQKTNQCKSKVLTTTQINDDTLRQVRGHWPDCLVVSQAKILGLFMGYGLTAEDYFNEVETRYISRLNKLRTIPMSMPMWILVLNIFVRSLLSYIGRFVILPTAKLSRFEMYDRAFISRVPYFAIGMLSHVGRLYGIRVSLQDLHMANIAAVIATAQKVECQNQSASVQLSISSRETPTPSHPLRPSVIFGTAFGCY
jgi:hypothetical protein